MLNELWQQAALPSANRKGVGENGGDVRACVPCVAPRSLTLCSTIAGVHTHMGVSVAWLTWGRVWEAIHLLTVASHVRQASSVLPAEDRLVLPVVLFVARV